MIEIEDASFGTLLRHLRLAANLTQEELAGRAGLSPTAISSLERGVRRWPYQYTVTQLMTALDVPPEQRALFKTLASRQPRRKTRATFVHTPAPAMHPASQAKPRMAAPPLVGRTHEKAWLERELAGERPVVLFTGEPGIGKTRLLYEAMDWAQSHGWQVLSGGCQQNSGQEPYAPLVEALERSMRALRPERLRARLHGCAWLARLLPEFAHPDEGRDALLTPPAELSPDQERRLMIAAIERYLSNGDSRAGTLLVVDDLQWASADTLHLLTRLVRSTGTHRIRFLGAYRSTDVARGHRLSTLVADLAREDLVSQLKLAPLAAEDAIALASALLDAPQQIPTNPESDALLARLVERAGGVPFFLVSYARWLQARPFSWGALASATSGNTDAHTIGMLATDPADGAEIPWDVMQSIRERVAALPASAQELLAAAAVVGRRAPGALLAEAAEQSEVQALTGLEMACQAGLLVEEREQRVPEAYRFAHDVIREVVEASLGAWRQRLLHRRIAAALERGLRRTAGSAGSGQSDERSLAQLAYHYVRADLPEKAADYLRQAGDRARGVFAHREAAAYYRELAQCLDRLGPCREAAQARRDLAIELARVASFGEAVAALEQAEQFCRATGDVEMLALVTVDIGNLRAAQGASEEGLARVQPLAAVLTDQIVGTGRSESPPVSASVAAQLHGALASLSFMVGRYRDALQTAERAVDAARATGDGRLLAREQLVLGVALFTNGRLVEAIDQLEQAIAGADAASDLETLAEALRMASWVYQTQGAFAQSQAVQERAMAVADRLGDLVGLGHTLFLDALLAYYRGDWGRARAIAESSLEVFRALGASHLSSYPPLGLGWLCMIEGRQVAGEQYLAEAERLAQQSGPDQVLRFVAALRAECELLAGKPEAANARLLPLFVGEPLQERTRLELLVLRAWAAVQLGERCEAEEALKDCVGSARDCHIYLVLPDALRVHALWAMNQRSWQEAEDSLREALALCQAMPYPYAEAKVLYVLGLLYMETGEPEQARIHLEQALAMCGRLGERLYGEAIERSLAALPHVAPASVSTRVVPQ